MRRGAFVAAGALFVRASALFVSASALFVSACALEPFKLPTGSIGGGGGGSTCSANAECADANPCSVDTCKAGSCVHEDAAAGTSCENGDLCDGEEACDGAGVCASPGPVVVDDGDSCTVDACDPSTGAVTHEAPSGCLPWEATPETGAPSARELHTAVWTGSKMIVWGGSVLEAPYVTATGGVFDPVLRTWTPTSMVGAPSPRSSHVAAWTGSKMIIWGGFGETAFETSGALYDPETDTWTPMTSAGAPAGRVEQGDVWTGSELLVWGGQAKGALVAGGGRYNPATDTWKSVAGPQGASPRFANTMVRAGDEVIMWGGQNYADWLGDGAFWSPAQAAWTGATSNAGAPEAREAHTALWTGSAMLIWGGWNGGPFLNSGGVFDPASGAGGTWASMSEAGAPSPRKNHSATWTGSAMLVFGGCGADSCKDTYGDGGLWTPGAGGGSWAPVTESAILSARRFHTAVWTGAEVIIWGGRAGTKPTNTGALVKL